MELEEALRRRRVTQPIQQLMGAVPGLAPPIAQPAVMPPPAQPLGTIDPTSVGQVPLAPPTTRPRTVSAPSPASPPVHIGVDLPRNSSRLQQLMAERQALSTADPGSKVERRDWGYEELPPEQSPSRLRQLGIGAAQGAMIAGRGGDPWGTLAGAAVGAITGGVSPQLMQAFMRRQELDRNAGELATEEQLRLREAQIGETMAQTEQRRLEPYLKAEELRAQNARFEATERGRNTRAAASNQTRMDAASKSNELRAKALEETQRHNKAIENRPPSNTRTVANTIFERDADGVWRVAPGAPPPFTPADAARAEREGVRSEDRTEKGRQAEALFRKGSEYWDQAKAKREEARRLGLGPDGNPSRIAARTNEDTITRLTREAEKLEEKTRDVQVKGDMLAAESESGPKASNGGRTIEGAVEAFRKAKGRAPTAEEVARMKKALEQ